MKLRINRDRVQNTFAKYVEAYDASDEKIYLKIRHTYRVAAISDRIARGIGLTEYDVDLAWLIGMLHDIGRFEQLRRYGTFVDADSIDHAHFAVELLFQGEMIWDYVSIQEKEQNESIAGKFERSGSEVSDLSETLRYGRMDAADHQAEDLQVINRAIWNHSAYRIEDGLDERTLLFSKIIRDADKVDIFKVAYDTPLETLYGFTQEEIRQAMVSPEVMEAYREKHAVLRGLKKTPMDFLVGHIALAFELEFPASRQVMQEQGYLQKLLAFQSDNQETVIQFEELRRQMGEYLSVRLSGNGRKA